jgi:hypothetical protein
MMGRALVRLIEDLIAGDLVAWGFVGIFAVIAAALGITVLIVRRNLRRDDEAWKNRHRGDRKYELGEFRSKLVRARFRAKPKRIKSKSKIRIKIARLGCGFRASASYSYS